MQLPVHSKKHPFGHCLGGQAGPLQVFTDEGANEGLKTLSVLFASHVQVAGDRPPQQGRLGSGAGQSQQEPLEASLLLVVRPGAPSSFLLLLIRHLLVEAMHLFLVASLLLVVRPGARVASCS